MHINQVNVHAVRVDIQKKVKTCQNSANTIPSFQVGRGQLKTMGYRKNKTVLMAA